ncbi:MAG: flagellar motor protein [Pseudomonadales bacterium]|nr:flagellar motor protein [Pseudomonadales bacterium]
MDKLSLVGVIVGFGAILGGNFLEGGHIGALMNLPAILIVLGGTLGAAMLQTPYTSLSRAMAITGWVFFPPPIQLNSGIKKVVEWSMTARKEGLLGLELVAEEETNDFMKKGLELLVDGSEPEVIRDILEVELFVGEQRDINAAKFYEAMGGYSPTIGIIGAVLGLVHVMGNLADPAALGPGIAVAFVATIYGVGLANLLFLPIASKLKSVTRDNVQFQEMVIEGIVSIAEGENPKSIELKLSGFSQT